MSNPFLSPSFTLPGMGRLGHARAFLFLMVLLSLVAGCPTLRPAVLDQKTQIENQILGTFERLQDDLILISSVRGPEVPATLSPLEREAIESMMIREFYRDDIDEFKAKQIVGEGNKGLLVLMAAPADGELAQKVKERVEEENRCRQIIIQRVIQLHRELSAKDLPRVQQIFYRLNLAASKPGEKVQRENGAWEMTAEQAETKMEAEKAASTRPRKP
jgi:hypothetical protein